MNSTMADGPDRLKLPRDRLCELARVERGKHLRWVEDDLLTRKNAYGELDLVRAALLDELNRVLKPRTARAVWLQIRNDLDVPGPQLEVVVARATCRATLIRSDHELGNVLPRGEEVVVVQLHPRADEARTRLRAFLSNQSLGAGTPRAESHGTFLELQTGRPQEADRS
jgi:hypothetical protein